MENKMNEDPSGNKKKKIKKTTITLIFMGIFSIVYFPLFFYIDGVILEMQTKKAIKRFMKENCQVDLTVTGFKYVKSWSSKAWDAITIPEFEDIRGSISKGVVDFVSPKSCGYQSFTLNRNISQFIEVESFKESYSNPKLNLSINCFFGTLFLLFMIYMIFLHIETKGMDSKSENIDPSP